MGGESERSARCATLNRSLSAVPSFDDQDDLPITWAFIRESYRWRPVSSGGKCTIIMIVINLLTWLCAAFRLSTQDHRGHRLGTQTGWESRSSRLNSSFSVVASRKGS